MRRSGNELGWVVAFSLGCWLVANAAWGEQCNPHLTCASTTPTVTLGAPKVTHQMCRADVCINTAFDIFDAALSASAGACIRIEDASTYTGVTKEFTMNIGSASVVVKSFWCHCQGTCSTLAEFTIKDRVGNTLSSATTFVCSAGTANTLPTLTDSTDADRTLVVGEGLSFTIGNTPTTGDDYLLCAHF